MKGFQVKVEKWFCRSWIHNWLDFYDWKFWHSLHWDIDGHDQDFFTTGIPLIVIIIKKKLRCCFNPILAVLNLQLIFKNHWYSFTSTNVLLKTSRGRLANPTSNESQRIPTNLNGFAVLFDVFCVFEGSFSFLWGVLWSFIELYNNIFRFL